MRKSLSLVLGAVVMLSAGSASASFHETKIVQVAAGTAAQPTASYIELRAYAAGQNFLSGHSVIVYAPDGTTVIETVNLANVANGNDQANVLIGTSAVATAHGVTPDAVLMTPLVAAGGKVCFDTIDCFAWGNYTGAATGVGTPFAALPVGMAAKRTITGGTNTTCLDSGDDTDQSAADFTAATPSPKNNTTTDACATTMPDAGMTSGGVDASTPVDSGVGTTPTPPRDGGTSGSSGTSGTSGGSSSGSDDSGCSVTTPTSEGWSTSLALLAAAATLVLARRRRA